MGPSSGFIITATAVYISSWGTWEILRWRHSPKMADAECVFLLALASARRRSYLLALSIASDSWVFDRGNTQQQLVVSLLSEPGFLAKNQLPTEAPEWITLPGIASWIRRNRRDCYVPLDSWSSTYGTLKECGRAGGGGGVQSAYVHTLELQLQRSCKPMDRGDCQGSLHSSWSSVSQADRLFQQTWKLQAILLSLFV